MLTTRLNSYRMDSDNEPAIRQLLRYYTSYSEINTPECEWQITSRNYESVLNCGPGLFFYSLHSHTNADTGFVKHCNSKRMPYREVVDKLPSIAWRAAHFNVSIYVSWPYAITQNKFRIQSLDIHARCWHCACILLTYPKLPTWEPGAHVRVSSLIPDGSIVWEAITAPSSLEFHVTPSLSLSGLHC